MLAKEIIEEVQELAKKSPHREICGVIVLSDGLLKVYPIHNVAKANNNFILHKGEYLRVINKVKAVYHSHISGDCNPSVSDVNACRRLGLPYLIVTPKDYFWLEP